jgi:hypothetical protein
VCAILAAVFMSAGSALAATRAAHLSLHAFSTPTSFSSSTPECQAGTIEVISNSPCNEYQLTITNTGGEATNGAVIELTDTLPAGLTEVAFEAELKTGAVQTSLLSDCKSASPSTVKCKFPLHLAPDEVIELIVAVNVESGAEDPQPNTVTLTVGGSPAGEAKLPVILDTPTPFGFAAFEPTLISPDGSVDTEAGGHPYEYRTRIDLNNAIELSSADTRDTPEPTSIHDARDIFVGLPPGLIGAATATPYCLLSALTSKASCPVSTQVGRISSEPVSNASVNSPLYNIFPESGVPAEFAFADALHNVHVIYTEVVPSPTGYVLRAATREIDQIPLTNVTVTFFGDPSARDGASPAPPLLTNSSDCDGQPQLTGIEMDSWQQPGSHLPDGSPDLTDSRWISAIAETPPVTGCSALAGLFAPSIEAHPETAAADSPTGLDVNIDVPQQEVAEAPGTPPLKDAVVTLPEGMNVNPSSANGLEACSLAQIGMSATGQPDSNAPTCPEASRIGTVELETPALPTEICKGGAKNLTDCPESTERERVPLKGSIYVAKQGENPFASLLAIYIVIDDARTGVIVKLAGEVKANEATGQLTTVVRNSPQFPFTQLRTHFFGGATASLRTPAACGSYAVTSELTPWSSPESGPAATPNGPFAITTGPGGGACGQPNTPSFSAGTADASAGAFSPLAVNISREDGSQNFGQISVTLPPGATGKLAGIPECSDAEIAQAQSRSGLGEGAVEAGSPSCPASTSIGTVTVGAGAGPKPFYVTGSAYLAGPYKGAPFSAVFITPAIAGPFDLGVVVVRAGLYVDPKTAQVTTRSDQLPTILHGIPLDIRSVAVHVDRPGFTLNPTSCNLMTVTGEETSTLGQVAPLSGRFQVGNCGALSFHPTLTASTGPKGSRTNGASLTVKITSGAGQSNIAKTDLTLPAALPSRLSTIQKACPEQTFAVNPAKCDEGSVIGTATAHTPLLSAPLSGPGYLVSHGGAAFPDVEFVLQGEGITLILDGTTDIKHGITYSRFETVPDAPVSSFEAVLPTGPHSALGAFASAKNPYNLCAAALGMPTVIVAQDGAVINQTTKIAVPGCPKPKALTTAQKLTKALKQCRQRKKNAKRAVCERNARKKYRPAKKHGKAAAQTRSR